MKFPVITIASSICIALALSACGKKEQQQEEEPSVSSPVSSVSTPESKPETPPAAQPASPSATGTPASPTAIAPAPEAAKPQESAPAQPAAAEKKAPAEQQLAATTPAKPEGGSDALALAQKSGCLACHSVEKKIVGPAWKDVSAKYKGDAEAKARLIAKVKAGGKGNWTEVTGGVPMPPYSPRVSDADIEKLVTFVLSLAK